MNFEDIYEGMLVRVIDWGPDWQHRPSHWSDEGDMDEYKGCIVTVGDIVEDEGYIYLDPEDDEMGWQWYAEDFEPFHQLPEDDPNRVYRTYQQNKRIAELRKSIQSKKK